MPGEFDVHYVAHLARIALTPAEEEKFGAQLSQVLVYVEKLKQVDVSSIDLTSFAFPFSHVQTSTRVASALVPTASPFPLINVTRPDEVQASLTNEEALSNAPAKANGLFLVPKIVE